MVRPILTLKRWTSGRGTQNDMTIPDAAPFPSRGKEVLVEFPQDELIAKWEEFFEEMGYLSKIIAVADRKSTRLNSSHVRISYAVFCLKKKKNKSISQLLQQYHQ